MEKEQENPFEMEREQEDLPPGFSSTRRKTRSSSENSASLRRSSELSQDKGKKNKVNPSGGEVTNTPKIIFKFRGEKINPNPTPTSEQSKKITTSDSQTQSPIPENGNSAIENTKTRDDVPENRNIPMVKSEFIMVNASDKGAIKGDTNDEAAVVDIVSFHGENDIVYTLSAPPQASDLTRFPKTLVESSSTICVKKGLISFLLESSPNDVGHMITQANTIFAFLHGMNAEYESFYNGIRAYIRHCLDLYAANQEVEKCKASAKLVSHYDYIIHQQNEMRKDVVGAEECIEKAKGYMAPLEARVQDVKELLEKLELELDERKKDLGKLEATKAQKMKELSALDVELKAIAPDAVLNRGLLRISTARRESAKIQMEKARNQLRII